MPEALLEPFIDLNQVYINERKTGFRLNQIWKKNIITEISLTDALNNCFKGSADFQFVQGSVYEKGFCIVPVAKYFVRGLNFV